MASFFLGGMRRAVRKKRVPAFKKWNLLRGDEVVVMAGKDKGKTGVVEKVYRSKNRVLVAGVNLVTKRVPGVSGVRGGHIQMEAPLQMSNVAVVDPATGAPTKVAVRYVDGVKVRVAKKSGTIIPRKDLLKDRELPRVEHESDTVASEVLKISVSAA